MLWSDLARLAGATDILDRAFYPLTLPLTVDPGSISVAITVGANHAHGITGVGVKLAAAVIGVGLIALSIFLTYPYAWSLSRRLGHRSMVVVVRLSAFIVLCIGVQIIWNGAKALAPEVGIPEQAPAGRSAGTTPRSVRYPLRRTPQADVPGRHPHLPALRSTRRLVAVVLRSSTAQAIFEHGRSPTEDTLKQSPSS